MSKINTQQRRPYSHKSFGSLHKTIDKILLRMFPRYKRIASRLPAMERHYRRHMAQQKALYGDGVPCPLCEDIAQRKVISSTKYMYIMDNDYPYYRFDGKGVDDHVMLVPRRHVSSLSDLDSSEQADYWGLSMKYSDDGYSTMTRPVGSDRRSVPGHVHTHLIRSSS